MILFPAIDLKDGQCVRLKKGDMEQVTVFNESPLDQALIFERQGFEWLHIVDLNGAFAGKPVNDQVVREIIAGSNLKVQLGGGIRNIETIDNWLELGVQRVILGTIALKDPELVKLACKKYPSQIVVGIDAKEGYVATEGWAKTSDIKVTELAQKFAECNVAAIIYTDIARDGVLLGPDLVGTKQLAEATNIPVIASGGVAANDDLDKIAELEPYGVIGVISGRAIYDGRIDLNQIDMYKNAKA